MEKLSRYNPLNYPVKILQFGEGNFLRAFVDWMIEELNQKADFAAAVAIVQPRGNAKYELINQQNGVYHVITRGIANGVKIDKIQRINCVKKCLNPQLHWPEIEKIALTRELRFVFSNTTEAGIVFAANADTFPAKLAKLLTLRANAGLPGLIFMPCELIENNGSQLQECIIKYLNDPKVIEYVKKQCIFCNTLVDRIVAGFPESDAPYYWQKIGFRDDLLVSCEPFHFLAIENGESIKSEFPVEKCGLNVVFTDNLPMYRTRKVRFLNGAHTASVLGASLDGLQTVEDVTNHPKWSKFLNTILFDEIAPTVKLPEAEKITYAKSILERFANPYAKHQLHSIALNSVAKFQVRVLPTILDYWRQSGSLPENLTHSLGYLINYYRTMEINDTEEVKKIFSSRPSVEDILGRTELWGCNLNAIPGFTAKVQEVIK